MKLQVSKLEKNVEEKNAIEKSGDEDDVKALFLAETCKLNISNLFMSNFYLYSNSYSPQRVA